MITLLWLQAMYSYFHSADFFEINRAHSGMLAQARQRKG